MNNDVKDHNVNKIDNNAVIEENLFDMYTNLYKGMGLEGLTKEQIEALKISIEEEFNLKAKVDNINIKFPKKRVIYVDGHEQLVYDDGEFFMEDTIDSKKEVNKLTKKKAMELYVEFFVRYTLNPLIEKRKLTAKTKEVIRVNNIKEKSPVTKEDKIKDINAKKKIISKVRKEEVR